LLTDQANAFNRRAVGRTLPVLLERVGRHAGQLVGKSPYLQAVCVDRPGADIGDLIEVEITECHPHSLGGRASAGRRPAQVQNACVRHAMQESSI
jgi:tRNA-2-methylthio-N6-dimethylallyladenosine synthase